MTGQIFVNKPIFNPSNLLRGSCFKYMWPFVVAYTFPYFRCHVINTLRPRQNGRHFADDIFKRIFLNENVWILIKISLKFVPKGPINNIPALPQWVNSPIIFTVLRTHSIHSLLSSAWISAHLHVENIRVILHLRRCAQSYIAGGPRFSFKSTRINSWGPFY